MYVLLFILLAVLSGPSKDAFRIHVTKVDRIDNGFIVHAQSGTVSYHLRCSTKGDFCHKPNSGEDYVADYTNPKENLVIYGVDEEMTIFRIDSEEEIRK